YRGLIDCPNCNKTLTGSKSKGRNRYYAYYHCYDGCKYRVGADEVNTGIHKDIDKLLPKIKNRELIKQLLINLYMTVNPDNFEQSEKGKILAEIKDYEQRLSHSRDLLATKQIDAMDYHDMKARYTESISRLESQLTD